MTDFYTSRHIIQKIWISIAPFKELKHVSSIQTFLYYHHVAHINRTI